MVCIVVGKSKMSEPSVLLDYIKTSSRKLKSARWFVVFFLVRKKENN